MPDSTRGEILADLSVLYLQLKENPEAQEEIY
jgi:hypothetical protein